MTSRSELLELQRSGRDREFRRARRSQRWQRTGQLWSGFGMRLGHFLSPVILGVVYLTLFLPFGLLGRLTKKPTGWRPPHRQPNTAVQDLRLQA